MVGSTAELINAARGNIMNNIEAARLQTNNCVAEYIQSHPNVSYGQIAATLGVSRWRVMAVASGIGITRKSGPKRKQADRPK
jgi:hypothetical protein